MAGWRTQVAAVRDSGSRGRDLTGDFVSKSTTAESSGQQLQIFAANYNSTRKDKGGGGGGSGRRAKEQDKDGSNNCRQTERHHGTHTQAHTPTCTPRTHTHKLTVAKQTALKCSCCSAGCGLFVNLFNWMPTRRLQQFSSISAV